VSRASTRQILVALNADLALRRDAVCRLGAALESWVPGLAAGPTDASSLGVAPRQIKLALAALSSASEASGREHDLARRRGSSILLRGDSDYPDALCELPLPPPVLYRRGSIPNRPAIAIVGSRRADAYGLAAAELFATRLAAAGLVVVSGLAAGIDTAAHRAALRAPDGRTVAVLGCGVDIEYPRGSRRLAGEIAARGAVLSELPMGAPPLARNFPVRNRIIAALGCACLVIQAAPRSGSLITAHLALELGRSVYAVPGRIFDEGARGVNSLIRDGAHPVQHPDDILEVLPAAVQDLLAAPSAPEEPAVGCADGLAKGILGECPVGDPVSIERLAARLECPPERLLATLLELELSGLVRRHPGPAFSRTVS
jgi:DNA processing protein